MPMTCGRKLIDLSGTKFGLWTVSKLYCKRDKGALWECVCVCGIKQNKTHSSLKEAKGCRSCAQKLVKSKEFVEVKRERHIYLRMLERCERVSSKGYRYYGSRGIKVSEDWKKSFWKFFSDMGKCPIGYSIERVDNDGDYCKENCKWIPRRFQTRNRTTSHRITISGETKILTDWVKEYGITYRTFYSRVLRGMSEQEAITAPRYLRQLASA